MARFERSEYLLKILGNSLLILIFVMIQTSFIAAMPWPINYLNLILAVIVFVTFTISYHKGLWFAFFMGLLLDLFSFTGFGAITFSMLLTVFGINFLFNNFFTNKSLYSLIFLGLLGNFIYILAVLFFNFLFFIIGATNNLSRFFTFPNLYGLLWQMLFNIMMISIAFFFFNFLSKKLKSVFY